MIFDKDEKEVLNEIDTLRNGIKGLASNGTFHSTSTGELIKGCKICAKGRSMTFVLGYKCNADCDFCFAPHYADKKDDDEKYNREACFKDFLRRKEDISGIGFTGGEPFLYRQEIKEYASRIKKVSPGIYFWIYTNGIDAIRDDMVFFRDLGIDEVRFNLAASGYDKKIIRKIKMAKEIFSYVAVEVPVYPEQEKLIYESLDYLEEYGADQLTLQELLINENNVRSLEGEGYQSGMMFNKKFFLYGSRKLSYEIIKYCMDKKYSFTLNECSTRKFGRTE